MLQNKTKQAQKGWHRIEGNVSERRNTERIHVVKYNMLENTVKNGKQRTLKKESYLIRFALLIYFSGCNAENTSHIGNILWRTRINVKELLQESN